jgi:diguanylate cyclase (GGDEF)-like protein
VPSITIDRVDRELERKNRLAFSEPFETEYRKTYLAERLPMVTLWVSVGTFFYCLAALGDLDMLGDNSALAVSLRFGIFVPYAIGVIIAMRLWPSALLYDALAVGSGLLGAVLPMSVLAFTDSPFAYNYQTGTVSTLLYVVVLLRPRFYSALIAVAGILTIQFVTTYINGGFASIAYAGIVSFYVTFSAFLLLVSFSFEQAERRSFLQNLRNDMLTRQLSLTSLLDDVWSTGDRSVAAIMVDIDYFKLYNDVDGHISGDNCIQTVSRILTEALGPHHFAFRYGGEELLAILPDCDLDEAIALAEKIRFTIVDARLPHHGVVDARPLELVTASFGVAAVRTSQRMVGQLLAEADNALYQSKGMGRNRVTPPLSGRPAQTKQLTFH